MSWEGISKPIIIFLLHFLLYGIILFGFLIPLILPYSNYTFVAFFAYLIFLFLFAMISHIKSYILNFSVKSWLGDEIERSKKDVLRQLCFTLKHSNVDFFRLDAWHDSTELKGYVSNSPENLNQKERMSCAFGVKR